MLRLLSRSLTIASVTLVMAISSISLALAADNLEIKQISMKSVDKTGQSTYVLDVPEGMVGGEVTVNMSPGQSPEALCDGMWMGATAGLVADWYTGAESYAVYQDPIDLGCTETYPFSVTDVHWYVHNRTDSVLTLTDLHIVVWAIDRSTPGCPRPGEVLYYSSAFNVPISPTSGFDLSINLASPICVSGPYFIGFWNPWQISSDIISIGLDDPAPDPARTCAVWNDWGSDWQDLTDYGFTWNLSLWSEGQSSTNNSCVCSETVTFTVPDPNSQNYSLSLIAANIGDITLPEVNLETWKVSGNLRGPYTGLVDSTSLNQFFVPDLEWLPGEVITSTLTNAIECPDGFLKNGYTWQFRTAAEPSPGTFIHGNTYSNHLGNHLAMTSADFNGDGYLDLATTSFGYDSVRIRLNDGNGQFSAFANYHIGTNTGSAASVEPVIFVSDLDGDGDMDMVMSVSDNNDGWFSILLNTGSGSFGQPYNYYLENPDVGNEVIYDIAGGDLDGDGDIDLAVAYSTWLEYSLVIYKNNGDGTMSLPLYTGSVGLYVDEIEVVDMDEDGNLDLILSASLANTIVILPNDGDGSFASPVGVGIGDNPWEVEVADLDGDNRLDFAFTIGSGVSVIWQHSNGTFGSESTFPAGTLANEIAVADTDGDGELDLLVRTRDTDSVFVLRHTTSRNFAPAVGYAVGDMSLHGEMLAADLDGDGDLDLATANGDSDDITILINKNASTTCCGQFVSGYTGDTDCDGEGKRNLSDITILIDRVYVSKADLCCEENGDIAIPADTKINLADITALIDHVYVAKLQTAACQ